MCYFRDATEITKKKWQNWMQIQKKKKKRGGRETYFG